MKGNDLGCKVNHGPNPHCEMNPKKQQQPIPDRDHIPARDDRQDEADFVDGVENDPKRFQAGSCSVQQ
ncbi:MAG: hypothetical protein IPO07_19080 [Haliscomenobacter sp.]|nr:hypothetical protein [Haliscomenobacter sp.]MBK9490648.1 hypothetical protein [Haliscomenobacter sp.]